jgi:hypothetical protein
MKSEFPFSSNSDKAIVPDNRYSSTVEVDQLSKLRVAGATIHNETYCIEQLRRIALHSDQDARKIVQELLSETVQRWISQHPRSAEACSLESEEYYITDAFNRFFLLIARQHLEFSQLSSALLYLKASLNSAILNKLRALSRPGVLALSASEGTSKQNVTGSTDTLIVWKILKESFPNAREHRIAYLLFHCGLSPKKIVYTYPQEFQDVQEILHLRYSIFERLLHRLNQLDDRQENVEEANATSKSSKGFDEAAEK